ncbi:MAG TPA: peptidoglycan-binding domain-containing protein [Acetobacteraceae bacterium]|jgi:peptidoglycan hydrolase-like protein with peptidoglycan-binding domain
MLKARTLGTIVALGALAALPACSMFGGGGSSSQYGQSSYASPASQTASAPQPGTTTTTQAAITPHMIRDVQGNLKQANLYQGRLDGVWGPMTQNGLRQWQQQHNMNATGQLDMATLQAMNITADNNQQAGQQNGTSQPNYSTAGNHANGSNYTNNNTTNAPQATQPNATQPANAANGTGGTGNNGAAQSGH